MLTAGLQDSRDEETDHDFRSSGDCVWGDDSPNAGRRSARQQPGSAVDARRYRRVPWRFRRRNVVAVSSDVAPYWTGSLSTDIGACRTCHRRRAADIKLAALRCPQMDDD